MAEVPLPPEWMEDSERGAVVYRNTLTGEATAVHPARDFYAQQVRPKQRRSERSIAYRALRHADCRRTAAHGRRSAAAV